MSGTAGILQVLLRPDRPGCDLPRLFPFRHAEIVGLERHPDAVRKRISRPRPARPLVAAYMAAARIERVHPDPDGAGDTAQRSGAAGHGTGDPDLHLSGSWPAHIQWLAFMFILLARGPGLIPLDSAIRHWRRMM